MTDVRRRSTRQREAVREALAHREGFVSAQTLHAGMVEEGAPVGLATVYRALAVLEEDGFADSVQREGETMFRACTPTHHHHLMCRVCGRAVEIETDVVESWMQQIAASHGYSDVQHTMELSGVCDRHVSA